MDLNLFLWNKTKVDILKYLFFKEDKISARELETKLNQSFPAIKKQIDNLSDAWIINKNKTWNRWSLEINDSIKDILKLIFLYDIKNYFIDLLNKNSSFLLKIFLVDFFSDKNSGLNIDIVIIYSDVENLFLDDVKKQISLFLDTYFLDLKIVFMKDVEYWKRLRVADKFVIKLSNYIFLKSN